MVSVRSWLSVNARMLRTCFGKIHNLCYFMIEHALPFFVCQPRHYQMQVKTTIYQTESILTFNCELCQGGFSALSVWQAYLKVSKNLFPLYICGPNDYTGLMFCSNFSFTIFSLMLFPLLWKVFTDILNIYELPKIHNEIRTGQFHVSTASGSWTILLLTLLKKCPRAKRTLLTINFHLDRTFFKM